MEKLDQRARILRDPRPRAAGCGAEEALGTASGTAGVGSHTVTVMGTYPRWVQEF